MQKPEPQNPVNGKFRQKTGGKSRTSPVNIVAKDRQRTALELRTAGWNFRRIAAELGVSVGAAHKAVDTAFQQLRQDAKESTETLVAVETERLDTALAAIWPQVEAGDLPAIDRLVKLADRRARLLGLDAPTRHELGGLAGGQALKIEGQDGVMNLLRMLPVPLRQQIAEHLKNREPEAAAG